MENGKSLEKMVEAVVKCLGRTAEIFDTDTGDHTKRIGNYCSKLAELLGYSNEYQEKIGLLAQLHDIGKINIHQDILNKKEPLTEEEFNTIKEHTTYGAIILRGSPELELGRQIAHFHHEKLDGSGYPDGLVGEEIPVSARITSVVDVFDALITKRVYKSESSYEDAFYIMKNGDKRINPKSHFDPNIHNIFMNNYKEFVDIHKESLKEAESLNLEILIVEDKKQTQQLLGEYLNDFDYVNLHQAESLEEAQNSLQKGIYPNMAFIDINLPDGNGNKIARKLRSENPDTYLVCTTTQSFVPENLLYDQILHKPYRLEQLGKIVQLFSRYR